MELPSPLTRLGRLLPSKYSGEKGSQQNLQSRTLLTLHRFAFPTIERCNRLMLWSSVLHPGWNWGNSNSFHDQQMFEARINPLWNNNAQSSPYPLWILDPIRCEGVVNYMTSMRFICVSFLNHIHLLCLFRVNSIQVAGRPPPPSGRFSALSTRQQR